MPLQASLTLIVLVTMFALMVWDRLPIWVVFLAR